MVKPPEGSYTPDPRPPHWPARKADLKDVVKRAGLVARLHSIHENLIRASRYEDAHTIAEALEVIQAMSFAASINDALYPRQEVTSDYSHGSLSAEEAMRVLYPNRRGVLSGNVPRSGVEATRLLAARSARNPYNDHTHMDEWVMWNSGWAGESLPKNTPLNLNAVFAAGRNARTLYEGEAKQDGSDGGTHD
jgi:hypothetical protein